MVIYPQADGRLYILRREDRPHSPSDRDPLSLDDFAQQIQFLDPFVVYEVTSSRLQSAAMKGKSAKDVLMYLRAHANTPLPSILQQRVVQEMSRPPVAMDSIVLGGEWPSLDIAMKGEMKLRNYQEAAVHSFLDADAGGIVVLPCGSGKTVVGTAILAKLAMPTLILVPSEAAACQWISHIHTWTDVPDGMAGLDDGKELRPITVTTYQRLTARQRSGRFHHLERYQEARFGLVIYDEVHLLPAKLFRMASGLRSVRKLGLSATLVREDGRVMDVLTLVGPIVFEAYAGTLSENGHLSQASCTEIRVPMSADERIRYEMAPPKARHRLAADNSNKLAAIQWLCRRHANEKILIMGHYTSFLHQVAAKLGIPMLSGRVPVQVRQETYEQFRSGQLSKLALSRIANVAIDLPNANVAIQVSGLFGSRQEEAQRLGRILRPSTAPAKFYSLITTGSVEEKHGFHRQSYLVEQGYTYDMIDFGDLTAEWELKKEWELKSET